MLHSACCLFPLYLFSCMMLVHWHFFTKCAKILNATAIPPTRSTSRYRCIDASSTLHGSKPLVLSAFLNFRYAAPLRLLLRPFLDKNLLLLRREHVCSTSLYRGKRMIQAFVIDQWWRSNRPYSQRTFSPWKRKASHGLRFFRPRRKRGWYLDPIDTQAVIILWEH